MSITRHPRRLAQIDILAIELPVGDGLQLDLHPRVERVDPLDQVDIDHAPVVEAERLADRVLRDLQPAVEVALERRLEVEVEVEPEVALSQPLVLRVVQRRRAGRTQEQPLGRALEARGLLLSTRRLPTLT